MENLFLIIDGSSMLSTNYYASLPKKVLFAKTEAEKEMYYPEIMQTSDGIYTNGIYPTLRMIYKIIQEQRPTHIAVVFDQTRDTFRREIYPEYKAQRKETPEPLKKQFIMMEKMLPWLGIPTFYSPYCEADDFAGSLVKKFESPETKVCLLTKDKDYLQLVSDYTRCWMYQSDKKKAEELYEKYYNAYGITAKDLNLPDRVFEFTPYLVKEEFGIEPRQVIDMKAIGGDPSDNIPGVKGVSEKTAVMLLQEFGSVEGLYSTIHSIDLNNKRAVKDFNGFLKTLGITRSPLNALTKEGPLFGENAAFLSKQLATIKCDIPLDGDLSHYRTNLNMDRFRKTCNRLEIRTILS